MENRRYYNSNNYIEENVGLSNELVARYSTTIIYEQYYTGIKFMHNFTAKLKNNFVIVFFLVI